MVFELSVPELGKTKSSKDIIISVLIDNWPLTLKEIYARAKKHYQFKGSYQALFKAIKELLDKKIVTKKQTKYLLNITWIKNLQSFTDVVETNYYQEEKSNEVLGKKKSTQDVSIITFTSVFDAEKYLYYFVKNELKTQKNLNVYYELECLWKVLFYFRAEYNYYTKLAKLGHTFFILGGGQTSLEKKARAFYKNIGIHVTPNKLNTIDTILFGDYFIQIFLPKKVREHIKECLVNDQPLRLLQVLDNDNESIKVIIHKDKALTKEMQEQLANLYQDKL